MTRRQALMLVPVAAAVACKRGSQTKEAVRQGVIDYLSSRPGIDVKSMQIDVTSVTFRQNEADALVSFRPRGSEGGGMEMRYTLEQKGNRWVVKGKGSSSAGAPHGSMGQMPPGAEQGGAMPPQGQQGGMPPAGGMPPGHPPVGRAKPAGK